MRESVEIYPRTAVERAMKLQEVLLRASAGKIKWRQAAEMMGISERQGAVGGSAARSKARRDYWTDDGGCRAGGECRGRSQKRF
jgi:hypothetical protein